MMTFYGCAALAKLRFTRSNAIILFLLWLAQFMFPFNFTFLPKLPIIGNSSRLVTSIVFGVLTVYELVRHKSEFKFRLGVSETLRLATAKRERG